MLSENELQKLPESNLSCVRCETPMRDAGELDLQVGGLPVPSPNIGMRHATLQTYVCPRCGKVEFFL